MKVLLVDDDPAYRDMLKQYLNPHFSLETADCGARALQQLADARYDAVVLDLVLPDMHGLDMLRKAQRSLPDTRFIVVTGYGSVEAAVTAFKLGAADFVTKPFEPEDLVDVISEATQSSVPLHVDMQAAVKEHIRRRAADKPILLISDNAERFKDTFETASEKTVHVAPDKDVSLNRLKDTIRRFCSGRETGCVAHGGFAALEKAWGEDLLRDYVAWLYGYMDQSDGVLMLLGDRRSERWVLSSLHDSSIGSYIDEVMTVLSHEARRKIIYVLDTNRSLTYSDLLEKLDMPFSSRLAYHLNLLADRGLIVQDDNAYSLTERGRRFLHIFCHIILQYGRYEQGNIMLYLL